MQGIKSQLEEYKRKYYFKILSKGILLSLCFFLVIFLSVNLLESYFWFDSTVRLLLLIILLAGFFIPFYSWVIVPLLELFQLRNGITDQTIAREVGKYFPEVDDRLVNLLELHEISQSEQSLIIAAIEEKEKHLIGLEFKKAVDLRLNLKFFYLFLIVSAVGILITAINPTIINESPKRIINFKSSYEKPAPFQFVLKNEALVAFKNESFLLEVSLVGDEIPQEIFLRTEQGRKIRLQSSQTNQLYTYEFINVQQALSFRLEGAGYFSKLYQIELAHRPEITRFTLTLNTPGYTGLSTQTIKNSGNAIIPEGTRVEWTLETNQTDSMAIILNERSYLLEQIDNQEFTISKTILNSGPYQLRCFNKNGSNKTPFIYTFDVIKDQFPKIEVTYLPDTTLFSSVLISGRITDDYGFSQLRLFQKSGRSGEVLSTDIPIKKGLPEQGFVYEWQPDEKATDDVFEIWLTVYDNDGVNGAKPTKSARYQFKKPNEDEIDRIIDENSKQTEKQIAESGEKSRNLNNQLEELKERLIDKQQIGWQEEKMINELIRKKQEIEKSIEELQSKHQELISSEERFKNQNESIREKSQQLQELMNELLDEETKALYDELKKLLEEKSGLEEVNEQLAKIQPDEKNLEKELERALDLFKRLKMEAKIQETADKLDKLGDEQIELSKEENKSGHEKVLSQQKQEEIKSEFEELRKEIDEIEKLNQDLKRPEPIEDFGKDEENIKEKLEELSNDLKQNTPGKNQIKQQNTGNKMKQLAQKMQNMLAGMEMVAMQENIDQLRDIVDNLVKLSFNQEQIILDFRNVSQIDPRFLELSQDQLRLVNNSKVVQDSLLSLASRVVQISNFITREIDEINRGLDLALGAIKERQKSKATSHQQFAMTSMNNLALLLDDILQQMQMAMAESQGNPKPGGQKSGAPSMSELQQQLSEQIKELKKSGKSGRALSEDLAKMAAEQARIRKQMEELQEKLGGAGKEDGGEKGSQGLKEAIEKMEQNEVDLVNKRLTENLIRRQEEILSRMLQAENSLREQEKSPEREAEIAKSQENAYPPKFEEYLKARKKEIELLNSIPLDLNSFYKNEVNEYFRRLATQEK